MRIWCLHGSLQTASVWKSVCEAIESNFESVSFEAVNLYEKSYKNFEHWRSEFCGEVEQQTKDEPSLLMGYSMGGRLAMDACVNRPDLWSGVITVGAHPGLISHDERDKQLKKDLEWSRRFRTEDIHELLKEWDRLPVFCGRPNSANRKISELDPGKISHFFDVFSKARQPSMFSIMRNLEIPPFLYISGVEDIKYTAIGKELASSCSQISHEVIPDAGHRVPWENQDSFVSKVSLFIQSVLGP